MMSSGTAARSRMAAIAIAITILAAACGGGGAPIDRDAAIAEADRQCDLQLAPASAAMRDAQNANDFERFLNAVESVTIPALENAIRLTDPGDFPEEDRVELEALHELRRRELAALAN